MLKLSLATSCVACIYINVLFTWLLIVILCGEGCVVSGVVMINTDIVDSIFYQII